MIFLLLFVFLMMILCATKINKGVEQRNLSKVVANIFYFIIYALLFAAL